MKSLLLTIQRGLHAPLILFLLFGLLLFSVDRYINGSPTSIAASDRQITISTSQQITLRDAFQAEHGRQPQADELQAKLAYWIDEQVLYREALRLNLDRADAVVRRQLAQKMRFLLEEANTLATPSDADLQTWLTQHASQYGQAPSLDFEHIFLGRGHYGSSLLTQAEHVRLQLKSTTTAFNLLGDPFPSGAVIRQASPISLRAMFGPDFVTSIQTLPIGVWSGPVASSFGLHFIRITARAPFKPASLVNVRKRVLNDYLVDQRSRLSQLAVARLRARYQIRFETAQP